MRVKKYNHNLNVYDASLERIEQAFNSFDNVVVSFSGGKDSTAVLNCALKVAREMKKLPLKVIFFDEEIIHPPTVEYVQRVSEIEDIDFDWLCYQIKHRNACSNKEPFWYTWDKDKESLWLREMPASGITTHKLEHVARKGMTIPEISPYYIGLEKGTTCWLTGIRTQESLRRYSVIMKKGEESFFSTMQTPPLEKVWENRTHSSFYGHVIYDWDSNDVWKAVQVFDWDYNRTYDYLNRTKMFNNFLSQRVAPPFGEEPLRTLWFWKECWPEFWNKMLQRVDGAATAWRYSNTSMYGLKTTKPSHLSYRDYSQMLIEQYSGNAKESVKGAVSYYIKMHKKKTKQGIHDDTPHPISGVCWRGICKIIQRGDFKFRQSTSFNSEGMRQCQKLGITLEEAKRKYR